MKIFFLFFLLMGCAVNDVKYKMPAARFNSPEVTGGSLFSLDLKGRANVNYGSSNRVSSTEIIAQNSASDSSDVLIEASSQLGARLDFSLLDRLDFYWNYVISSPSTMGLKWQFLGKTESSFTPGWKSSLTLGYGSSSTGKRLIPIENESTQTYSVGMNDTIVYDFYWLIGYRFPQKILFYLNLNYTLYENELTYKMKDSVEMVKPFNSDNWGLILGFQYYFNSKNSFLILELGYSQGQVETNETNDILTGGINFGWRYD